MKLHEEFKLYENMWEQSLDEGRGLSKKGLSKKADRPSPDSYFDQITASAENAVNFIKDEWAPWATTRGKYDLSSTYAMVLARETSGQHVTIAKDPRINYKAFLDIVYQKYGLNVKHMIKTGNFVVPGIVTSKSDDLNSAESAQQEITQQEITQQELEISPELTKKFHKQNIRILLLLDRYTNIRRNSNVDWYDLLDQLDENRLKDIKQSERDFQGI